MRVRASCDNGWKPLLFERGGGSRGRASNEVEMKWEMGKGQEMKYKS